jgi:uncharacterized membrane protein
MNEEKLEKIGKGVVGGYLGVLFIIFIIKALILLGLVLAGTIKGILGLFKGFL